MWINISIILVITVGISLDILTLVLNIRRIANWQGPSGIPLIPLILYAASVWNLQLPLMQSALLSLAFLCFHVVCQFLSGMLYTNWVINKVPLHKWSRSSKIAKVTELLDQGIDVDTRNAFSETALHVTARYDRAEIASMLLSQGADPNAKDNQGYTPLHLAVAWGHIATAKILSSNGADANITNNQGLLPRAFVSKYKNPALYAIVDNQQH